ncbi:MAG: efflux RND transporter permease subunit [Planctomycetes bacterium]|nr:efflux RND transporter permease subunit [Planctomycetota bacterium]
MSLASVSIRNPVFAWMLMAGLIVFGWIGFKRLGVGQYPDVDFPVVTVTATLQGAAPEVMESTVVDVLEDAVMAVEGVREITSVAKQGQATVTVEFEIARNIELALQDVQARVSAATRQLPKDLDPPIIQKVNPEENPIMWVAVTGTRSPQELAEYAKNSLRDRFLTVEGNGDVRMGGYLERNVRIWVDPLKLLARGLAVDDVITAVQRQHVEVPAGRIESRDREANVRVEGEALNVDQMRKILVAEHNGAPILLKDVALVQDGFEDERRYARIDGIPAQGLGIVKQHGANSVALAEAVRDRVKELNKTIPAGMEISIRADNTRYIEEAINETEFTLVLSVFLTALVCWVFLGSLSSTFNVIMAIPVSVFGTFALMYFCGFTLNTFTLLALSLSIGIVVDDAVMVLENIYRHAEMRKDRVTAAREGAEEISFAALAATLAIIAIFLPVAFMKGVIGKFFFQFGVVLSVAVAISLLEALTLAPARCSQFLTVSHRGNLIERAMEIIFNFISGIYKRMLGYMLHLRSMYVGKIVGAASACAALAAGGFLTWYSGSGIYGYFASGQTQDFNMLLALVLVVGLFLLYSGIGMLSLVVSREAFPLGALLVLMLSIAIFGASMTLFTKLPAEMVPPQDQGVFMARVVCPVGSSISYTDDVVKRLDDIIRKHPEIDSSFAISGGFGGEANEGLSFVTMKPSKERPIFKPTMPEGLSWPMTWFWPMRNGPHPITQQETMQSLRKEFNVFPGTNIVLVDFSQSGFASSKRGGAAIDFSIRGPDWDKLGALATNFAEQMRASNVMVDVDTDYRVGMPEVQIFPNRSKMLSHNVDVQSVGDVINALIGGAKIAQFKDNGRRYDVRIRLLKSERVRPEDVGGLYVRNTAGSLVKMSDLVDIAVKPSLQSITRLNRERAVSMYGNPAPGHSQDEALNIVQNLAAELPKDYHITFSGNSLAFKESIDSLNFALLLGLAVAYMVLASQFNSFLHPITVLSALPFSLTGALLGLYIMGQSINVYSMIGIILLMGIVKKNSILLVDFTNQVRAQGKDRESALLEACPTRLRPILMTSMATIAGAMPGAMSLGPGGELRIPMSVAVIGGVIVSTLLTLFVVPCFYSLADEWSARLLYLWRGLFPSKEAHIEPAHVSPSSIQDASAAGK